MKRSKRTRKTQLRFLHRFSADTVLIIGVICALITTMLGVAYYVRSKNVAVIYQKLPTDVVLGTESKVSDNGVIELGFFATRTDTKGVPHRYQPPFGHEYVCVSGKVRNISGSEKWFIPVEEILATDEKGNQYKISGGPTCMDGLPGGPLQPAEQVQGDLGFTVPTSVHTLSIYYVPTATNVKAIKISDIRL